MRGQLSRTSWNDDKVMSADLVLLQSLTANSLSQLFDDGKLGQSNSIVGSLNIHEPFQISNLDERVLLGGELTRGGHREAGMAG